MALTPTPNMPRLRALLEWAEQENKKRENGQRSEWDQGTYVRRVNENGLARYTQFCGTACCLAGKTVLEDGVPLTWANRTVVAAFAEVDLEAYSGEYPLDDDGETMWHYARQALGLTYSQANALFDGDNTLDAVRALVDAIEEGVDDADELRAIGHAVRGGV